MVGEIFTILFVCTGNTCRSSMAEALARKILTEKGAQDSIKVISAGTAAMEGMPASPEAVEVMNARGIDLASHQAQKLTPELIREADIILTMTQDHKSQVISMVPSACSRVYTLKDYILERKDDSGDFNTIMELISKLESKEQLFYAQYGPEIERLKKEYNELASQLHSIEDKLLEIEEEFARQTQEERQMLALFEESKRACDISDPFGGGIELYNCCADEMEDNIDKALGRFLNELE